MNVEHLQSGAGTLPQIAHLQLRGIPVAAVPTQGLGIDTEPLADGLAFVEINAQRDAGFGVDPGQQPREARAVARARHHAQHVYRAAGRSEEHTSELQSLMRISYAVFCLKKKKQNKE